MLEIKPFKKGFHEEDFVRIFNAAFADYDDIRSMTLEDMEKLEKSPSFDAEGMLIALWNGEIAGTVNAHIDKFREEEKGFIQYLSVLPQFRGKGIAKKLVEKTLQNLKLKGAKVAETWEQTDRDACIHIFESFGFKPVRATNKMTRRLVGIPSNVGESKEAYIREVQVKNKEEIKILNMLDNETTKEQFNFRPKTIEETMYTLFETPWYNKQAWFFAILNDKPVGYAGIAIDEDLNKEKNMKVGWIYDIGVLKPYRRKGIGTLLMLKSMQSLKTLGLKNVSLYVDEMNPTKAIKLYEKLGFKVTTKIILYQLKLT